MVEMAPPPRCPRAAPARTAAAPGGL